MPRFHGAYTALVTPFTDSGASVDLARLEANIKAQAVGGVQGIVPCGTTGEAPTLSTQEQAAVIETAVRVGRPLGLQVVAGTGSNSTEHAIELHRAAHALGADASLQVSPYYSKPSQEGLYRHFMAVAESCSLPIMLYNIPGRCGVAITPETVERLARHPNIVAIKEATGSMDSASEIRQRCGITVLSGDDTLTIAFAAVGATGVVSVLGNILPDRVARLCALTASNDFESARREHADLFALARGLLTIDTNPMPIKAAMMVLGLDSGALRLPMCALPAPGIAKVRDLLRAAGFEPAAAFAGSLR